MEEIVSQVEADNKLLRILLTRVEANRTFKKMFSHVNVFFPLSDT